MVKWCQVTAMVSFVFFFLNKILNVPSCCTIGWWFNDPHWVWISYWWTCPGVWKPPRWWYDQHLGAFKPWPSKPALKMICLIERTAAPWRSMSFSVDFRGKRCQSHFLGRRRTTSSEVIKHGQMEGVSHRTNYINGGFSIAMFDHQRVTLTAAPIPSLVQKLRRRQPRNTCLSWQVCTCRQRLGMGFGWFWCPTSPTKVGFRVELYSMIIYLYCT